MTAPAEVLPWDSEFFGVRVARALDTGTFGPGAGRTLVEWCESQEVRWLYALLPPTPGAIQAAEESGFRLIDVRVELAGPPAVAALGPTGDIRPYRESDLPVLQRLARESHRDSRFFADPHVPDGRAELLFERWIEHACRPDPQSWAGVVEAAGTPAGYLTAHLDAERRGWIDLFAVGADARGKGLGAVLVAAAGRWMVERGAVEARVVTQGRNIVAQRLYQQAGFRTDSLRLWYHRWFGQ